MINKNVGTILGFDIASRTTGWAVITNGKVNKKNLGLIKINPKYSMGKRLHCFAKEIKNIINKYKPDIVFLEDIYRGRNAQTFKTLSQFRGIALYVVYSQIGSDPYSIMPSQIRKILGIPNNKEDVFDSLNVKYGLKFNFKDHNDIVDALAICIAGHTSIKNGININVDKKKKRKRKTAKK